MAQLALAVLSLFVAGTAFGQSPENVAVVVNENSAASQLIAQDYIKKRGIPESNVIRIHAPVEETIDRPTYLLTIEQPVLVALGRNRLHDRILYIVLTKGVPLRITGNVAQEGTAASVDSELTLLYRKMVGVTVPITGHVPNPYFLGEGAIADAHRFTHRDYDIYLVTRLDAFTVEEAQMLVETSLKPTTSGQVVLDQRDALTARTGEDWLSRAAQISAMVSSADRVVLESTPRPVAVDGPVLGYFSWGATDPQLRSRFTGMHFVPGALAATFAGADARTFLPPPPDWRPMKDPANRSTWFGGSPQSLVGDLIREGATGVAGNVAEPYLQGVVRPDILFPAYLSGFNLVESFYLATPFLSWETVIVGDPLVQPFARKAIPKEDAEPPIDTSTELPQFFSERRMRLARALTNADTNVAALMVRAEGRIERGDRAGARTVLTQLTTTAAPELAGPHLRLALLDEAAGDHDAAMKGYRRVVELQPKNIIALNNLAYGLAVYGNAPMEAEKYAVRAVNESKRDPTIVDTLAWIEHLLGHDVQAETLLVEALRGAPTNADIRLHAAIVAAARGKLTTASAYLKEAVRRNPALERAPEVEELRGRLPRSTPTSDAAK